MEIAIIVFMCIVGVMTVFSIVVTTIDLIKGRQANNPPQIIIQQIPVQVPNEKENKQEQDETKQLKPEPLNDQDSKVVDKNAVVISAAASKTLDEKYVELAKPYKNYYDSVAMYCMANPSLKRFKNNRYEEYKIGNNKVVRLTIKREMVYAEFFLVNHDIKELANGNKVKVKQASTSIKIEDETTLDFVKGSIDIAIEQIKEEITRKKQAKKSKAA